MKKGQLRKNWEKEKSLDLENDQLLLYKLPEKEETKAIEKWTENEKIKNENKIVD
jgi:hypothetical protein